MSKVTEIAYHRNGVGGDGFWVAKIDTDDGQQLVGIVPGWAISTEDGLGQDSPGGGIPCFIIDPALAAGPFGTIAFGENSWRGDQYFGLIAAAARDSQKPTRYAIVRNARDRQHAETYLPSNYEVVAEVIESEQQFTSTHGFAPVDLAGEKLVFVIEGKDDAGWTLDGYVIPRYASGLIWAEEIELGHGALAGLVPA